MGTDRADAFIRRHRAAARCMGETGVFCRLGGPEGYSGVSWKQCRRRWKLVLSIQGTEFRLCPLCYEIVKDKADGAV